MEGSYVVGKTKATKSVAYSAVVDYLGMCYFYCVTFYIFVSTLTTTLPRHVAMYDYSRFWHELFLYFCLTSIMLNFVLIKFNPSKYIGTVQGKFNPYDKRLCPVCMHTKANLVHHCPICEYCVSGRDHHCFFTSE